MSRLFVVCWKELADHFSSWRFIILSLLVYVAGVMIIRMAAQNIRSEVTDATQFVFLKLFASGETSFLSFQTLFPFFILPIVGITLGFDAINSERANGTLSRLLSQPLYRDSVINGKFLAGIITLSILVLGIVALVAGMGLYMIGVPPMAEEIFRLIGFVFISIIYGAFWMSLAILFSVFFRRIATSALASIAMWIFFFLLVIVGATVPIEQAILISRVSPISLYGGAIQVMLIPNHPALWAAIQQYRELTGVLVEPNPLSFSQSLLIIWPQLTSLIALTALCFAVSYIRFMREEIRST
jgi:ABC-2 type transport system permease protein